MWAWRCARPAFLSHQSHDIGGTQSNEFLASYQDHPLRREGLHPVIVLSHIVPDAFHRFCHHLALVTSVSTIFVDYLCRLHIACGVYPNPLTVARGGQDHCTRISTSKGFACRSDCAMQRNATALTDLVGVVYLHMSLAGMLQCESSVDPQQSHDSALLCTRLDSFSSNAARASPAP